MYKVLRIKMTLNIVSKGNNIKMTLNLVFKGNNIHTNCIVKDHEGWPPIGPINYVDDLMS